jgi:hypothetical protein
MKNIPFLFVFACFSLFFAKRSDAQCYVRLEDASGFNTDAYQDTLQAAAAKLCAIFDSTGFAGQFKVYDFGFYLHQENTTGGYPEPFVQKMAAVQDSSPYYLLFGKQTDKSGVYTGFWVDLVLPDTGKFECLDLLSVEFRNNLTEKIKIIANTIHSNNFSQPDEYYKAELGSMDSLINILDRVFSCCDPTSRPASCSGCLYTPADISILFQENGFVKVPITILNLRNQQNSIVPISDSLTSLRMLLNFDDLSNLEISIDGESFDLDNDIFALLSSVPAAINGKGVFTDNNAFCLINPKKYFSEINLNQYGVYFWAHVWNDPYLIEQPYLFFKINFGENGVKKSLPFNGNAPLSDQITYPISKSYVNNTISNIFGKNGYVISTYFNDKDTLEWSNLYNYVKRSTSPQVPNLGWSLVDVKGISIKENFIEYKAFESDMPQIQRDYVLGYALSHEFTHQIMRKSYMYIFPSSSTMKFGENQDHVKIVRNILFPGDGFKYDKEFLLPQDKNVSNPFLQELFYFSGNYIPKKNNIARSAWEEIINSHKRLINHCWLLRNVEISNGKNSPHFVHLKKIFSKDINLRDHEYSMP